MASKGYHQRTTGQDEDWTELTAPDEKETIDGLLSSLERGLQGDEACQLVAEVKRLLEKREANVVRRCEREKKELKLQLESDIKNLEKRLFSAQQDLRKHHEKEKSPASSSLVHQLQRELADTKAMREKDKEVVEKLRKKLDKRKAKTEELRKIGRDPLAVEKRQVSHLVVEDLFGKSLGAKTVEQVLIQSEHARDEQKKQIKELKKEVERKDKHIERMSQRILDTKKEKELLELKVKRLSAARADMKRLSEENKQLQKDLTGSQEDKKFLEVCLTQLKAKLPSAELERFQLLADEVMAKQVAIQDLRQQVAEYETMISDYSARYCREMGEAAEMHNVQQRKVERLELQIDQLQQLQAQVDQLQHELQLAKVQNEVFEKDFQQERKDRERAHTLVDQKDKELQEALSEITVLQLQLEEQPQLEQQPQSFFQKQTGSWRPFKGAHTQPQMSAKQVAELEEAKATAVQQVRSYKTLADGYKKDLKAERKETWELKQELEAERKRRSELKKVLESSNPASSAMGAAVEEKVHFMSHELQKTSKELDASNAKCAKLSADCARLSTDCAKLRSLNQTMWRKLQELTGMVDTQLPVETPPAHGQTAELLDAAKPAQGRQEHQRGDICQAGQSRVPLSSTEEHRMHAAMLREPPQQGPESDGNAMEMQMHSKNTVPRTDEQWSSTLSSPSPAQTDAESHPSEQVVPGRSKYLASNLGDFTDEDHRQYGTNDVAKLPEPEEAVVGENKLVAGIDQEIEDVASEVREMVKQPIVTQVQRPVGSYEIPADPNLVCPKCNKQFKHGEIQKLRLHYHHCER